ncbi:hypothetical protein FKM82_026820, partial [Ascaphus truei]
VVHIVASLVASFRFAGRGTYCGFAQSFSPPLVHAFISYFSGTQDSHDSDPSPFPAVSMTTDVSGRPTSEDRKDTPPRKSSALGDGAAPGPENGGKEATRTPQAIDPEDPRSIKEPVRPQSSQPMDHDGHSCDAERRGDQYRSPEGPELSLAELSISSKQQQQQQQAGVRAPVQPPPNPEEPPPRVSRKRKMLDDTESSKSLLLEAYRVWQQGQKVTTYDLGKIEKIMCKTYMLIKQVDEGAALEQAIKFCQLQIGAAAQRQVSSETGGLGGV